MTNPTPKHATLLTDGDGVCFDFVGAVCRLIYEESGLTVTSAQFKTWKLDIAAVLESIGHHHPKQVEAAVNRRMLEKGFCASIPAFPGTREALETIDGMGVRVVFVTSPYISNPFWMDERFWAVRRHFGLYEVISIFDKTLIAGDLFIDDKPEHVLMWSRKWSRGPAATSSSLLWDTPQNKQDNDLRRVFGWSEVIELVGQMPRKSR